jgi:hypothetical protein
MKPHDSGVNRWGMADNNDIILHSKRIVNSPQKYMEYEKYILCRKMLFCEYYNFRFHFADNRHESIYGIIEPFYKCGWGSVGFNIENFIQYVYENKYLEYCGGADYIRSIFQKLEIEGGLPI